MLRLLQSIFAGNERPGGGAYDEGLIERATERLVDVTDPRLRAVSGYKRKLRAGVECAVDHAIRVGDAIAGPLELSRSAFGSDPRVRALFASPEHLDETLNASADVQQWLSQSKLPPDVVYALLVVTWEERHAFGMELEGDMVRRDVAQVVVNFGGHRFPAVAGSESEARWEVKKRAFDLLVKAALARLVDKRKQQQNLERERLLLANKLKELESAHLGLSLENAAPAKREDPAAVEARVHQIEQELATLRADAGTLDDHMTVIADTLSASADLLTVDSVSFVLDQKNVKRNAPDGQTIHAVEYPRVRSGDRRAIATLVQFPRTSIRPPKDLFAEAERYLR